MFWNDKGQQKTSGFPLAMLVIRVARNVHQGVAVYVDIKNTKRNARRLFANRMVPKID